MGQQQLLLVILVTILVGIATVVAINVFGESAEQANADAVRQDLLAAASQAQAIYAKPAQLGGAGGDFATMDEGVLLQQLRIPGSRATRDLSDTDDTQVNFVENENGIYTIDVDTDALTIIGEPSTYRSDITLVVTWVDDTRSWTIDITETSAF